jgi:hypothetical protein
MKSQKCIKTTRVAIDDAEVLGKVESRNLNEMGNREIDTDVSPYMLPCLHVSSVVSIVHEHVHLRMSHHGM